MTNEFTEALEKLKSGKCPQGFELNLFNNQIGEAGAIALAEALRSGKCTQGFKLYLDCNDIGDAGARALAGALASGKCPEGLVLHLRFNQIGAAGAQALAEALRSGKCPFGTKITGVNDGILALCKQNDERIIINNREKYDALSAFFTFKGDPRFPRKFVIMLSSYMPGDVSPDILFELESSIRVNRHQIKLESDMRVNRQQKRDAESVSSTLFQAQGEEDQSATLFALEDGPLHVSRGDTIENIRNTFSNGTCNEAIKPQCNIV